MTAHPNAIPHVPALQFYFVMALIFALLAFCRVHAKLLGVRGCRRIGRPGHRPNAWFVAVLLDDPVRRANAARTVVAANAPRARSRGHFPRHGHRVRGFQRHRTRGRPHRIYVIGGLCIFGTQLLRPLIAQTDAWRGVTNALLALGQ